MALRSFQQYRCDALESGEQLGDSELLRKQLDLRPLQLQLLELRNVVQRQLNARAHRLAWLPNSTSHP